jgi:hypothetical protein
MKVRLEILKYSKEAREDKKKGDKKARFNLENVMVRLLHRDAVTYLRRIMLNNPASLEAFPDQVTSNEPLVKFQVW